MLKGQQTQRNFETLRPMLDGSRTVEDLQAACSDVAGASLMRLLSVLNDHGFLKDGPVRAEGLDGVGAERALLWRWLEAQDATNEHAGCSLADKTVYVVGECGVTTAVAATLAACEVRVESRLPDTLAGVDLLVFAAPGLALGEALRLNRLSLASSVDYLPVTFDDAGALIGPVVRGRPGPCLHCLLLRREANSVNRAEERRFREWRLGASDTVPVWLPGTAGVVGQWSGELALRQLTSSASPAVSPGEVYRIDFLSPAMTTHMLRRVPFCPACGDSAPSVRGGRR